MGSFGERMQREREMRGITLAEIAESTKIGTRALKALEDEEFSKLPGGIFNKGFVRAYARYLGINEEQAVSDFLEAAGETEQPAPTLPPAQPEFGDRSAPEKVNWRAVVVLVLAGALAVAVGWKAAPAVGRIAKETWHGLRGQMKLAQTPAQPPVTFGQKPAAPAQPSPPPQTDTALPSPPRAVQPSPSPETAPSAASTTPEPARPSPAVIPVARKTVEPASPKPVEAARRTKVAAIREPEASKPVQAPSQPAKVASAPATPASAEVTAKPPAADGFVVLIKATKDTWVSISADGRKVMEDVLSASTLTQIRAQSQVVLRAANASAIEVSENGKHLVPLGGDDQETTVIFTPQGMQR